MNIKIYLIAILGAFFVLGGSIGSQAGCLTDCDEATSEMAEADDENDRPNQENERTERTQHFGNIRDSVVLNGVSMKSDAHVSVGSNSGDINNTSSNVIMGVNKSHNNTNNTTNHRNR